MILSLFLAKKKRILLNFKGFEYHVLDNFIYYLQNNIFIFYSFQNLLMKEFSLVTLAEVKEENLYL